MSKILGLDIGSNSVGWALIDDEAQTILGMGVRVFPEAVEKLNTEQEHSKNVQRRLKRQLRKQYDRRRRRIASVRNMLMRHGLLPTDSSEMREVMQLDPYVLRYSAIREKLPLHQIGKIIDHINSRRGFQSNRKSSSEEETTGVLIDGTKDGQKPGIGSVDEVLHVNFRRFKTYEANKPSTLNDLPPITEGYRTLGEYLHSLNPHEKRRRNRFTLRDHYRIELDMILEIQQSFYPEILTPALKNEILKAVFFQRPLKSVRHLVGKCRFEPGKKRSHKSHPDYQEFRFLQQFNALRIRTGDRIEDDDMKLTPEEQQHLLLMVNKEKGKKVQLDTQEKIKKYLGWKVKIPAKSNFESLDIQTTIRDLRAALGRTLVDSLSSDKIEQLWNVLQFAEDYDWVVDWVKRHYHVSDDQAQSFARIKLEDGYGSVSLRAVRKILPYLREGMLYHEAVIAAGYDFNDPSLNISVGDRVPSLAPEDARNPIVQRSFAEMRRVVNAIVRKWGNPDIIRVEMARELRLPVGKRAEIEKSNRKNRDQNAADKERLKQEFALDDARRNDVLKLRLWEEQQHVCIYSGRPISKNMLFDGSVDVDHILPYSRTLDDSRENKVVCLREMNQQKSDMTPMEAIHAGLIDEREFTERVKHLYASRSISEGKMRKLLMSHKQFSERYTDDPNSGFVARQLNDTRFASRLALRYLRHVSPQVQATTGQMTAMLRRRWGLDGLLPELASLGRAFVAPVLEGGRKDRDDHRHHAVDALTVALIDRSLVNKISALNRRSGNAAQELNSGKILVPDVPIPGLYAMALNCLDNVIVSHRKTRPGRGALHAETLYGVARARNGEQKHNDRGLPMYVVRKQLSPLLSSGEIQNIVDPVVREAVLQRLVEFGVDVAAEKFTVPKDAFIRPLYYTTRSGVRHVVKKVRIHTSAAGMVQLRQNGVYVEPSGNDHIRIVRGLDKAKHQWEVRTLMDEATKAASKFSAVDAQKFVTLRIGDLVLLNRKGKEQVYKVQKMSRTGAGEIALYHHADASGNVKNLERPKPASIQFTKLSVDVLGFIHDEL